MSSTTAPAEPREPIGYQSEFSAFQSCRKSLRDGIETLQFEAMVLLLVCVYAVIIFIDLATSANKEVDPDMCIEYNPNDDALQTNETLIDMCQKVDERDWLYDVLDDVLERG